MDGETEAPVWQNQAPHPSPPVGHGLFHSCLFSFLYLLPPYLPLPSIWPLIPPAVQVREEGISLASWRPPNQHIPNRPGNLHTQNPDVGLDTAPRTRQPHNLSTWNHSSPSLTCPLLPTYPMALAAITVLISLDYYCQAILLSVPPGL